MTSRQIAARKAWRLAKRQREIATKGERDRTMKHLADAATEVLMADNEARKARRAA